MFDHILNWKLLEGSHKFPGPDGGTCINEAAVIAAGFKYRQIGEARDCPRCFSRPISAFAIQINDAMTDELRQELLMPFVTRLAGTRDTPYFERARAGLMVLRTLREVMPIILRYGGLYRQAEKLAVAKDFSDAAQCVLNNTHCDWAASNRVVETPYRHAIAAVMQMINDDAADAADEAACAISNIALTVQARFGRADSFRLVFTKAVSILDEAIKMGNQAMPIETAMVVARMEAATRPRAVCPA